MFFVLSSTMKKGVLFLLLIPGFLFGQTISNTRFGASFGVLLNFGSHVNTVGLSLNSYYQDYFYQINVGSSLTYNLKGYGNRSDFWESRTTLGVLLLGGKRQIKPDFQLNGLFHNSSYNYGIGYNYIWYYDNAQTSQLSGGWSIHLKNTAVLIENDVFGGQAKDRFRTGHIAVTYRNNDIKLSTGLYIWTGETANSIWTKIRSEKCPSGYRILEDLPYGKTSHGILYGGISYNLGYAQFAQARIGLDSERIRHIFQNRLAHDLQFLPSSVERNTPHYPRLDAIGCPVFNNDSIRKNKLYFQIGSNENWSN
jgi:hypothetical protein